MKIFCKSLYNLEQIKSRSIVGEVDGIELLIGWDMKENRDILNYAKDHFNLVSLETLDYFYDGAGLDLMSDRKDVRESSRKFIDTLAQLTVKYDLFPFSMHFTSGSVPFRQGDNLDVFLGSREENLHNLKEYVLNTYGAITDRFCFENGLLLDFMGKGHVTLGNVGRLFEDTIFINGKVCFDISHYSVNFLLCHEAKEKPIHINGRKYPNVVPDLLRRETENYKKNELNRYLEDLIANAPSESIQRFHVLNMYGIDPEDCEGSLEGHIDLKRIFRAIKKYHPRAILVPEIKEIDYLNPVRQKKFLDLARRVVSE